MENPTIKDVAALAGVSVGTVSMVLNNSLKVSEVKKALVLNAIKKLSYRRNPFARSLSMKQSKTIGFLVPDLVNPFFGELTENLQSEVEKHGYSLMIGFTNESYKREAELIEKFLDYGVDGIFYVPVSDAENDKKHFMKLVEKSFPLVSLVSYYPEIKTNCIMVDLKKGSYDITKYLLDKGHKKIFLVSGNPDIVAFSTRIEGFKEAHNDMGIKLESNQIIRSYGQSLESGYKAITDLVIKEKPDAIIAINDVMAMGILGRLKSKGMRVPDDISVAGYDDLSIDKLLETPLSSVRQPLDLVCNKGVELMLKAIESNYVLVTPEFINPSICIRSSIKARL